MLAPRAYQLRPLATRKPAAAAGPLLTNLLAYYDFESLLVDVYAGNNLTNNNSVSQATGNPGQAASIVAASSQYLSLAGNALLLNSSDLTVQAWVYPTSIGATDQYGRCITHHATGEAAGNWWISVTNQTGSGKVTFAHWRNTGADTTGLHTTSTAGLLPLTTWTHVVARRTAGTYEIRVNNVAQSLAADISTASGWTNTGFQIGRMYTGGSYSFDGRIDGVGIWSRSLSTTELTFLYNSGAGRTWAEIQAYT